MSLEVALEFQILKSGPVSLFVLPVDPDVELSVTSPAPCLPSSHHASHHANNGINL